MESQIRPLFQKYEGGKAMLDQNGSRNFDNEGGIQLEKAKMHGEKSYGELLKEILEKEEELVCGTKDEKIRDDIISKHTLQLCDWIYQNHQTISLEETNRALENLSFRSQKFKDGVLEIIESKLEEIGLAGLFREKLEKTVDECDGNDVGSVDDLFGSSPSNYLIYQDDLVLTYQF